MRGCISRKSRISVIKALETRTSASKPYTVADMPPHAGPLGRINIPYDSEQYRDLLEWLYSKHKSQPSGNLIMHTCHNACISVPDLHLSNDGQELRLFVSYCQIFQTTSIRSICTRVQKLLQRIGLKGARVVLDWRWLQFPHRLMMYATVS